LKGFELLQGFEGAVVVALGLVDPPLEVVELLEFPGDAAGDDFGFGFIRVVFGAALAVAVVDGSFGAAEAAEEPFVVDEGVDEGSGFGGCGVEAFVIFGGEGFELGRFFEGEDFLFGIDAGLEGVG